VHSELTFEFRGLDSVVPLRQKVAKRRALFGSREDSMRCKNLAVLTLVLTYPSAFAQCPTNVPHINGTWTVLPYQLPINPISANLLPNGKMLIVAGSENDASNNSRGAESYRAAVWDPTDTTPTPTRTHTPANNLLNNIYAYYKMDEASGSNATDATGNGRTMVQPGTIGSAVGIINTGRLFTGGFSGPFLLYNANLNAFEPDANPFFITCWIKSAATNYGYDAGIAGKYVLPRSCYLLYRQTSDGRLAFQASSTGNGGPTVMGPILADTNWHFLAAGWDGTNVKISVDNSAFTTVPFAGPVFHDGTSGFQIGSEAASNTWNGVIDEVAVWIGRSLTQSEVSEVYNGGVGLPFSQFGGAPTPPTDFNHDGKPDYVLYNGGTRQTAIWYMNNNVFVRGAYGPSLPAGWSIAGVADFNGDGKRDYLLFNSTTRQSAIWYLNNNVYVSGVYGPTLPSGWQLMGTADFNGDGKPDYVLYNSSTRQTAIWYLNNNIFSSGAYGPTLPTGWNLVAP
jgi:hypothetical protein